MHSLKQRTIESTVLNNADNTQQMEAKVWRNLVPRSNDVRSSALHAFSLQHNINESKKRKRLVETKTDGESVSHQHSSMDVRSLCECSASIDTFDMLVEMYRQVRERQLSETLSLSPMECNVLTWSSKYLDRVRDEKCASLGRFLDLMRREALHEADLDMLVDQTESTRDRSSTEKTLATLTASIAERTMSEEETRLSEQSRAKQQSRVSPTETHCVSEENRDGEDAIDPHIACGHDIYEALVKYHGGWFRPDIKYTSWDRMTKRVMAKRRPTKVAPQSRTAGGTSSVSTSTVSDSPLLLEQSSDSLVSSPASSSLTSSMFSSSVSSTSSTRRATVSPPARMIPTMKRRLRETLEGRRIVTHLSNDMKLRVVESSVRFPIETLDLYARFFTECGVAKLLRHEMDLEHAAMSRKYWEQLCERKAPRWTKTEAIEAVMSKSRFAASVMRAAQNTYLAMEEARLALMPLLEQFWPSMMQLLTCVRLRSQKCFALWSTTGSGKLTAALMAAKFIGARRTLVVTSDAKMRSRVVEQRMGTLFGDRTPLSDESLEENEFMIVSYEQLRTLQDIEECTKGVEFLVLDQAELAVGKRAQVALLRQNLSESAHVLVLCSVPTAPQSEGVHSFVAIIELLCGSRLDGIVDSENDYALAFAYAHLYGFYYETPITVNEVIVEAKIQREGEKNYEPIAQRLRQTTDTDSPSAEVATLLQPYKKFAVKQAIADATTTVKQTAAGRNDGDDDDDDDNSASGSSIDKVLIYTSFVGTRCSVLEDIVRAVREQFSNARIGYAYCTRGETTVTPDDAEAIARFLLPTEDSRAYDVLIGTYLMRIDEVQCVCKRLVLYTLPTNDSDYESLCGTLTRWGQPASEVTVYIPRCVLQESDSTERLAYEDVFLQRLRRQARVRKAVLAGWDAPAQVLQDGIDRNVFDARNTSSSSGIVCNEKKAALSIVLALLQRVWSEKSGGMNDGSDSSAYNDDSAEADTYDASMVRAQEMLDKTYDLWMNFTRVDLYEQCIEKPDTFWRPFHLLRDTVLENRTGQSHPAHAVAVYIMQRRSEEAEQKNGKDQCRKQTLCVADIGCGRKPLLAAALDQLAQGDDSVQAVSSDLLVEKDMRECIVQAEASTISNEDLPDNAFDFVVCCQSLMGSGEHMAAIVCRLRRALRYDKGRLIIVQPTNVFVATESVVCRKNKAEAVKLDALEVGLKLFDRQMAQLGMIPGSCPVFFGDSPEFTLLSYCRFGSAADARSDDAHTSLCYPARM